MRELIPGIVSAAVRTELDSATRRINDTLGMTDKHPHNA
jgi:hypothetical protein